MNKTITISPVAWVRRHPDGALTAEFLEDAVIEPVRKNSGAWVPLYTHPALSQPRAEALVAAALEAALDAVQNVELNCETSGAAIKSAERLIRALDKQQIIESCKEKS